MIRKPKDENEKTFLEKFGEKEFDAVVNYEDDLYNREVALMDEINKKENKIKLNSLIKDFCSILANDKDNALNPLYVELIEKEKEFFSLNFDYSINQNKGKDIYCDTWKMLGGSNVFGLYSISNIIRGIYLECTNSRMCTLVTPFVTGWKGLYNSHTPDYHNKEEFIYFYAQISVVLMTFDNEIKVPVIDLFFGEDKKEWLIQKNKEKDYSDIPFYPDMSYYVESNREEDDNEKTKSGY